MRDPNEITSVDRERWMKTVLAGMKKLTEPPSAPKNPPAKQDDKIAAPPAQKSKVIPERESFGAVNFAKKRAVNRVDDTDRFRSKIEKQLKKVIGRADSRQELIKGFIGRASVSGRLRASDAKRAIMDTRSAGQITSREARKLIVKLGI